MACACAITSVRVMINSCRAGSDGNIKMACLHESPEYRAIQKHNTGLTVAVVQGNIPGALFQNDVIDDDTLEVANSQTKTTKEKGATIMRVVRQTLRLDPPKVFKQVCDAMSTEPSVEHLLDQLKGVRL